MIAAALPSSPAWSGRSTRPDPGAGVLYLHWFAPPAAIQNRTEFRSEPIDAAGPGAVAVLPQLTFPWNSDPVGTRADRGQVELQLAAVTRAYRYLLARPGVNARRTAVVGHDYGAMYGALPAQEQPTIRTGGPRHPGRRLGRRPRSGRGRRPAGLGPLPPVRG